MYYGELIPGDGCYINYQSSAVRVDTYEVQIQTSD
jgi:hypothetical protein